MNLNYIILLKCIHHYFNSPHEWTCNWLTDCINIHDNTLVQTRWNTLCKMTIQESIIVNIGKTLFVFQWFLASANLREAHSKLDIGNGHVRKRSANKKSKSPIRFAISSLYNHDSSCTNYIFHEFHSRSIIISQSHFPHLRQRYVRYQQHLLAQISKTAHFSAHRKHCTLHKQKPGDTKQSNRRGASKFVQHASDFAEILESGARNNRTSRWRMDASSVAGAWDTEEVQLRYTVGQPEFEMRLPEEVPSKK